MNKIHKSQYNEALGTWVAVPEFAKSRGRQANSVSGGISMDTALPKFAFSALTVAVLQVISPTVWAATTGVSYGYNMTATCVALGADGQETDDPYSAVSTICAPASLKKNFSLSNIEGSGVVVGNHSYARMSTAVGNNTYVNAKDGIAIGHDNIISSSDAIVDMVGVPHGKKVSELKGGNSISVGSHNRIHTANTLALGNNITKTKENSIFLGNETAFIPERSDPTDSIGAKNAKDKSDTSYAGMTKLDSAVNAGGSKVIGVVSVGNENATRRIQGVAPGLVAKDSTDAINGGQLAAAYKKIDGNTKNIAGNTENINNINERTTVLEQGWKIFNPENPNPDKAFAVKAKDTVKFTGDEHTTVKVAQVEDPYNDKQTITTVTVGLNESDIIAHPPVVYTNKDGDILRKVDGKWYKAKDFQPDGKLNSSANKVDDIVASLRNPSELADTRGNPYRLTNIADGEDNHDAVNVSQLRSAEEKINKNTYSINSGRLFTGDDANTVTVNLGKALNLKGGADTGKLSDDNIAVVSSDDSTLNIKLSKELKQINSIELGDSHLLTINKEPGRIEGLTNTTLDNLDNGTKGTAATEAQLGLLKGKVDGNTTNITNNTNNITKNADVIKSGRVFAGDDGKEVKVALGEILNLKGGAKDLSEGDNIGVVADDNKDGAKGLKIRLNKDLSGLDSIALGSDADKPNTKLTNNGITIHPASEADISLTDNGLDNGNKKIVHVNKGTDDSDAVNFGQLKEVKDSLFHGFTIRDGASGSYYVKPNDTITFTGGKRTSVKVDGSTVTIGLDDETSDKLSGEIVKTLVGNFDSSATPDKDGKTHLVGGYTGLSGKPSTTEIEDKLSSENLAVIQGNDGHSLAVVMAKDPTFRKLSATDSITVGDSAKPITIIKPGRIEGLKNITLKNLDDGTKGTAATEAQLDLLKGKVDGNTTNITNNTNNITKNAEAIKSGRVFAGDDSEKVTVALGETLNLKGDASASALSDKANIGVIADKDAKGLKIRLNKDLSGLNSIALGSDVDKPNTKLTNNGITIHPASGADISLTDNGLDNGNNKIVHVAKGLVDDSSTDAINGSQLHNVVTSLGGGAGFSKGTYTPPKYVITTTPVKPEDVAALVGDNHPANNVGDAIKNLNNYVNQGFFIRDASNNNYQVIPGRTVTFNGTTETVVAVGKDKDGNGTVTVGLAEDAARKINGSVQKLAGNVGTASPDVAGVTHIEGAYQPKSGSLSGDMKKDGVSAKNIAVVGRDEHTLNVVMSESPDFHKVTATGTTVNPDGKANVITVDGDTGHIDGLTNVTLDSLPTSDEIASGKIKTSKAATEAQLRRVIDQATKNGVVINKGRTFKGDDAKAVTVGLGDTLNITGGAKPDELSQANNLGVVQDGSNGLKVRLNKNISGLDSVALGTDAAKPTTKLDGNGITITPKDSKKAPVSLTDAGLNNGMNKITNVADGIADNDAVNVSQLKHVKTEVTEIHNKIYNGWNLRVVGADDSDKGGMVESDGKVEFDSRPTDTAIARSVASKPHKNINIGIERSTGKQTVFFDLDKDVKVESVTTGDSMVNNGGLSTGNGKGPAVQSDGIDMKRHKIRSLSPGEVSATSEEGVNGSQLHAVADAIKNSIGGDTTVTYEGDNKPTFVFNNIGGTGKSTIDEAIKSIKAKNDPTTVKSIDKSIVINNVNEGKDAAPSYEVSLAPVVDVDKSLTVANKVTINNNGISAGNTKITNVTDGRIAPDSQDAVNGRQLYKVAQNINDMDTRARSGIASAMAAAGLPQAYLPGKSMVSAAASHYRGENAIAVGVSSISDNGKWLVKADANANRKDFGVSLGVGYQW